MATPTTDSIILLLLPHDIITEILLRLPTKSLSKFMCVSKSWLQIICSPHFVKNYMKRTANDKEFRHHTIIFRCIINGKFKFCSLPPLFTKQQVTGELFHIDSPLESSTLSIYSVGSVNGLLCVFNEQRDIYIYIWNPTINKSKELPKFTSTNICNYSNTYGFGYDQSRDDYKVIFIGYRNPSTNMRTVVNIYSLRTNSWTTLHDQLQGIFLLNFYSKFVNGKLYWTSSTGMYKYNVCNITCFDLADGIWGSVELTSCGEDNSSINLGVVGCDLSLLYTCATTADVWIMKHSGVNVSWKKLFTIKYPRNFDTSRCYAPVFTFSVHFRHGEILLVLRAAILIYDGSTGQLKHTAHVKNCHAEEIYVESLVNPLTISDQGRRNHETPH